MRRSLWSRSGSPGTTEIDADFRLKLRGGQGSRMARKYTLSEGEGIVIGDELTVLVKRVADSSLIVYVRDTTGTATGSWRPGRITLRDNLAIQADAMSGSVKVKVVESPTYSVRRLSPGEINS